MPERRFPPPWSVEEGKTSFVVKDYDGQQLAYVYFRRQMALNESTPRYCPAPAKRSDNNSSKSRRHDASDDDADDDNTLAQSY